MTLRVTTSNETAPDVSVATAVSCRHCLSRSQIALQATGDKDRQRYRWRQRFRRR